MDQATHNKIVSFIWGRPVGARERRLRPFHDAARHLAQSILQFLDDKTNPGRPSLLNITIVERPEPQEKKS